MHIKMQEVLVEDALYEAQEQPAVGMFGATVGTDAFQGYTGAEQ